jgi:putative tryptophan/tyrosine transport system substrate-binding protein
MEIARKIVPNANRIGLLTDLKDPKAPPQLEEQAAAGRAIGVTVLEVGASGPGELDDAMRSLAKQQADVVIVLQSSMLISERRQIAESALAQHLPTVYGYREHVVAGGLISYGVDLRWCYRRGAYFVDKILHGTPPGELPVEFPTKMMLSINLKTAKALGLTVPPSLLATADEVIE